MLRKLLAISLLLLTLSIHAAEVTDVTVAQTVRQIMTEYMTSNQIPGAAVEVYVDGKPSSYYFGYANRDKKISVSKNTIFELGSITKVMTSLLLAQEVDSANMQFGDSVTNFLTSLPNAYEDITLMNLATNTSGLPFELPEKITRVDDLYAYLPNYTPPYSADERWIYSNVGIGLLGYALETETHQSFNQLYIRRIMQPLHMQPFALTVPARYQHFYAQGYDNNGQPVNPAELGIFPSAYAVKSSAGDMQKFLAAAIGLPGTPDRIFYPMRMTEAVYVRVPDKLQGLGWQIHEIKPEDIAGLLQTEKKSNAGLIPIEEIYEKPTFHGDALIDKTGSTNGFRAYIAFIPNKKTGIVILTNRGASDNAIIVAGRKILFSLAKIDMGMKPDAAQE